MFTRSIIAALTATTALSGAAFAQDQESDTGFYINAGGGIVNIPFDGLDAANIVTVQGRLGVMLSENFAVEADVSTGVINQEYAFEDFDGDVIEGSEFEVGLDFLAAGFAVGRLPFDGGALLIKGGYYTTTVRLEGFGADATGDSSGFAAGGGLEIGPIRADYTYLATDEEETGTSNVNMFSLAFVGRF